jgi:GT2 family glycosyltransferase
MISIITIVKNDPKIELLLHSFLYEQRHQVAYEYIVVDASNGALKQIADNYKDETIWIPFTPATHAKTTIPEQRNAGIKTAKGDIIVFIDSDCVPQQNWIETLIEPIQSEGEDIVAGGISLSDRTSLHAVEFEKKAQHKYIQEAPTMNIAISKRVFDDIGLFDEDFQAGEDVDLLWRAIRKGYKIRYLPSALVYHDLESFSKELRRMYVYGKARVQLYKKNRFRLRYFWGNEFLLMGYPFYILLIPISYFFPLYLFFLLYFAIRFWRSNPLKMFVLKTVYGTGVFIGILGL